MAIDSKTKLIDLEGLKRFKNNLDVYEAGDNITFTPDASNAHKIKISSTSAPQYIGATSSKNAISGIVPAATSAEKDKFLKGDGTWDKVEIELEEYAEPTDVDLPDLSDFVTITRTINGKNLSTNISLTAADVGALPTSTVIPTVTDTYSSTSSNAMSGKAVAKAVGDAIAGVTQIDYTTVTSLPATGQKGMIYLIADTHGTKDVFDEYIYVNDTWEKLGNTDVDLSEYAKTSTTLAGYGITDAKIDNDTITLGGNSIGLATTTKAGLMSPSEKEAISTGIFIYKSQVTEIDTQAPNYMGYTTNINYVALEA